MPSPKILADEPAVCGEPNPGAGPFIGRAGTPLPADPAALELSFHRAADLAAGLRCSKRTVLRRAAEEGWPIRHEANRLLLAAPPEVLAEAGLLTLAQAPVMAGRVRYTDLHSKAARERVLARQAAVEHYLAQVDQLGVEVALSATVMHFRGGAGCPQPAAPFSISTSTLRRWAKDYSLLGLDGLVDQKQAHVGRKPVVVPERWQRLGQALAHERGSVARAARELASHPELPANLRRHLHEGHASKSYVTPSIRAALKISQLTEARLQGPRAARLAGRWTPGDYSNVPAGRVFVADDMTSNVLCWTEWPNARGWVIAQAQVLALQDVGSLRWLAIRVIVREGGQYSGDDIWGLFGDAFDQFGLPDDGFLLEGGHWQSNRVIGHRTGLTDDERLGGLASMGLHVYRAWDPRGKGMHEGSFNQLQYVMDGAPGYAGRDQRKELPETVKHQVALCKGGHKHPREFFLHQSQLADHVQNAMERLNHERQDGQILRGACPLEKWAQDAPRLRQVPDTARWLYRSAMSLVQVTRNGVRVTQGSGAKMMAYYYDNPELLVPRQGTKLSVFWNDANPDADAILVQNGKCIGSAKRVQPLNRFDATDAQLAGEAARKKAALHFARTESRAMQPNLARSLKPLAVPVDAEAERTADAINRAAAAADAAARTAQHQARQVNRVRLSPEDLEAMTDVVEGRAGCPKPADQADIDELADLLSDRSADGGRAGCPQPADDEPAFLASEEIDPSALM